LARPSTLWIITFFCRSCNTCMEGRSVRIQLLGQICCLRGSPQPHGWLWLSNYADDIRLNPTAYFLDVCEPGHYRRLRSGLCSADREEWDDCTIRTAATPFPHLTPRVLKPCPHCRRKVRLSPNSATVALFCDSVDRALHIQRRRPTWAIGARGGLQFCRPPPKSWDARCPLFTAILQPPLDCRQGRSSHIATALYAAMHSSTDLT